MHPTIRSRLFGTCVAALALSPAARAAAEPDPTPQSLAQKIDQLSQELEVLKAQLQKLNTQPGATPPGPPVPVPPAPAEQLPSGAGPFENLSLWGYGELYYTRPVHEPERTQADLARAVFGIGYRFDDRTTFNSEYEVEHAVASASDAGEFEVEQFYVNHELTASVNVEAGLFLMPFGLLNEHHEPTNFYGVQRNFVETLIIPSTWREGGVNLHGSTEAGIAWNIGVTTGPDLSKWSFTPEFPQYLTALELEDNDVAPLQATHQELGLSRAEHPAGYLALNYSAIPGVLFGGALFRGTAAPVPAPPKSPLPADQVVTLWETHARWTPGPADFSAVYAHGAISNLAAANAENPGSPNPIPSSFWGFYLQGAYTLWQRGESRFTPFSRFERYDLGASYEGTTGPVLPTQPVPVSAAPGDYGYWPVPHDDVWTIGASYYLNSHVVVKGDYQYFQVNHDFARVDFGLGLNF
jgi:opacity protein-like surface antigen